MIHNYQQQQQQQHNYQYQYHHHNYHQPKRQRQRQNQNHFPYHLPHQPHPNNNNGFEYQFGPQSSPSISLSSMQNINTEYISNSGTTNANIILPPLSTPIPSHSIIIPSALMPVSNPRCSPIQTNIPNESDEEKRQRNTLASARFRIRRKMKEQELERVAKEMTEKARSLECKVKELEKEVKLLKGLIVEIDSTRLVKTRNSNNKELLKKVDDKDGQNENGNYTIRDHERNSNYHDNSAGVGSSSGTNLGFSINDTDVGDGRSNQ
nr:7298_t:CDS:2 [Entrophospora candida]